MDNKRKATIDELKYWYGKYICIKFIFFGSPVIKYGFLEFHSHAKSFNNLSINYGGKDGLCWTKDFTNIDDIISIERGDIMNQAIVKLFTKTKDALLVEKHFKEYFDNPLFGILFKGKEGELLALAEELEKILKGVKELNL